MSPKKAAPEDMYSTPEDYFDGETLKSYTQSKSLMHIQEKIVLRALELSSAKPPAVVLDLGMGSGFSSVPLFLRGFTIIGMDLLWDMLIEYPIQELNPIAGNMLNLFFRENTFDYIFSVSAFQWAYSSKGNKNIDKKVICNMAESLHRILKDDGSIIFQVYESSQPILDILYSIFSSCSFTGKYIIDNPQSKKKKKTYLYLHKIGKP